jgi:hypothetical protein
MSKTEKNDILDKHKTLYDGYVTEYGKPNNQQPLYVQDFANDKDGITVSNKGEVKKYTNVNINEDLDRRDQIGDGPYDLKNGTVDMEGGDKYPSPNEDDAEFISIGFFDDDDDDWGDETESRYTNNDDWDDDDYYEEDDDKDYMNSDFSDFTGTGDSFRDRVDDDELPDFMEKLNESLDMFRRFKRYN